MKTCKNCNNIFTPERHTSLFCGKSCSASYNNKMRGGMSSVTKEKIRAKLKRPARQCEVCGDAYTSRAKTCSIECGRSNVSATLKRKHASGELKSGGIREGSGRGKCGWYRGLYLNSTYEIAFIMYYTDHGLNVTRNKRGFSYYDPDRGSHHMYYPDFMTDEGLVEIKGYKTPLDDYKLSGVTSEPIKIMYKAELASILDYAKEKSSRPIKRLFELYDK